METWDQPYGGLGSDWGSVVGAWSDPAPGGAPGSSGSASGGTNPLEWAKALFGYDLARNGQNLQMQQNTMGQRYREGQPMYGQQAGGSPLVLLILAGVVFMALKD